MKKDLKFNEMRLDKGIMEFSDPVSDTECIQYKLQTKTDFAMVLAIATAVFNDMLTYQSGGIDMYAVKQPLLVYHIADNLSNIDVSELLNYTTDESGNDVVNLDINKANQLCTSELGTIIYRMMLLDIDNDEYNSIFQIHQLLNKKIELFERQMLSNSPTDYVINEVYSLVHEFKEFAEKLNKQADKVDISKAFDALQDMTPQNLVNEYLSSKFSNTKESD